MHDFYQLSIIEQESHLQSLAKHALRNWGLEAQAISLIKHRENAVFEVTANQQRYALRIHRHGYHSDAALRSELQWIAALDDSGFAVPAVVPTLEGQLFVSEQCLPVPELRQVDLFSWIDGEQLGTSENGLGDNVESIEHVYRTIGCTAATLHNHAQQWSLPQGFVRHAWDAQGLVGDTPLWGQFWQLPALTPSQLTLITKARTYAADALASYGCKAQTYGLIHADFAPENLLVDGTKVRLIDFDDAGFGWHMFELATALYFIQQDENFELAKTALLAGYREQRVLSDEDWRQLSLFMCLRGFTYLGWAQTRPNTETALEMTPWLIELACAQAEEFLALH